MLEPNQLPLGTMVQWRSGRLAVISYYQTDEKRFLVADRDHRFYLYPGDGRALLAVGRIVRPTDRDYSQKAVELLTRP